MLNNIISTSVFKNQSKDGLMIRDPLKARIRELIHSFAKFDKLSDSYTYDYQDLDELQQEELAGICMASDESWAAEATGPDNPRYSTKMLPALIAHMKDPLDLDLAYEFKSIWRDGICRYFEKYLTQEIYDLLGEYNSEMGFYFDPETEYATAGNRG